MSGIFRISYAHLEEVYPDLERHAHFSLSIRGKVRPARASLVQAPAQGSHLRVDARMRSSPRSFEMSAITPPVLSWPEKDKFLYLYLDVTSEVISVMLI